MNKFKDKKYFLDLDGQPHKLSKLIKVLDDEHTVLVQRDKNPIVEIVKTERPTFRMRYDQNTQSVYVVKYEHRENNIEVEVKPKTYNALKRYMKSKTI